MRLAASDVTNSLACRWLTQLDLLIAPTARPHTAWLDAHHERGPGVHEDGFGLRPSDEVDSPAGFAA